MTQVKVDATDFEQADDGYTTHYGGEIRISNDTNVDIVIKCSGSDRGDDPYWTVTEAVLNALFPDGVPGVVDEDYATEWEEFHDNLSRIVADEVKCVVLVRLSMIYIATGGSTRAILPIPTDP